MQTGLIKKDTQARNSDENSTVHNTVHCRTVQYIIQYTVVQYSKVQYSTVQYSTQVIYVNSTPLYFKQYIVSCKHCLKQTLLYCNTKRDAYDVVRAYN